MFLALISQTSDPDPVGSGPLYGTVAVAAVVALSAALLRAWLALGWVVGPFGRGASRGRRTSIDMGQGDGARYDGRARSGRAVIKEQRV